MASHEKKIWKCLSGGLDHSCEGYNGRPAPYDEYQDKYDGCRCSDTDIPESKWCNGCLEDKLDELSDG